MDIVHWLQWMGIRCQILLWKTKEGTHPQDHSCWGPHAHFGWTQGPASRCLLKSHAADVPTGTYITRLVHYAVYCTGPSASHWCKPPQIPALGSYSMSLNCYPIQIWAPVPHLTKKWHAPRTLSTWTKEHHWSSSLNRPVNANLQASRAVATAGKHTK